MSITNDILLGWLINCQAMCVSYLNNVGEIFVATTSTVCKCILWNFQFHLLKGGGCIFVFAKDLRGMKGFYAKLFSCTPDWTPIYSQI